MGFEKYRLTAATGGRVHQSHWAKSFEYRILLKTLCGGFAATNRRLLGKQVGWNWVAPYDFLAENLAKLRASASERAPVAMGKNPKNTIWWPILLAARTEFAKKIDEKLLGEKN